MKEPRRELLAYVENTLGISLDYYMYSHGLVFYGST